MMKKTPNKRDFVFNQYLAGYLSFAIILSA